MRLHHLTVTAFGPFPGTVEVDFDDLGSAGLFLLTGATGAGKTSVLDAVCFALYGQVPGDRAGAKHLRSDHAGPTAAPEVRLHLSIGDRQLAFTRSPAWSRPKLRGTGETRVQAHVVVEELRAGTWTVLTNRLDDAGLLVTDLLGMTAAQFTQVAMLPQGRFQAFLRATSTERHAVLQQLFRTDRFERVERWLVERRAATRRSSEEHAAAVSETVSRLLEAAGAATAPEWADDLTPAAEAGEITRWVRALVADTDQHERSTATFAAAAEAAQRAAGNRLESATRSAEHRARGVRARTELEVLAAGAEERAATSERIDRHRRAQPVLGLAARAVTARREADEAAQVWATRRAGLARHLPGFVEQELDQRLDRARHAYARAVAFETRERGRIEAVARLNAVRTRLQTVETTVAEAEVALTAHPGEIAEAVAAVHEARAAAARLPGLRASAERLDELVRAAKRAATLATDIADAREELHSARTVALSAREHYLVVREARINGMAAELAGQLASGCSCPVCGSAEHPAPAGRSPTTVGQAEEDEARRASETAAFEVQAREVGLSALESEASGLAERLGDTDHATLPERRLEAYAEVERLEPLVAALDVLQAQEQACRARLQQAEQDRAAALLERAALGAEADQLVAVLDEIASEWAALLDDPGAAPDEDDSSLTEVVAGRARLVSLLEAGVRERDAATASRGQADATLADATAAACEAGFDDLAQARGAVLESDVLEAATHDLRDAEVREHAARLSLADPAVLAALAAEPVDLDTLAQLAESAAQEATAAASAASAARARSARVLTLEAELRDRLASWGPVRDAHRTVAGLASLVEGKSVDNPQRMRLAAYVLAERLRQVVAAANERLAAMTDHRYLLEHTDDRGYGEQRGGLSLRVRDAWNGVRRDPATLSGGETFVVSLALALGLADTVAHEAGGVDIDTLFIDEGFGSLDADTLEDVMDTLDSLRDGGRVVGLVSHVPELRSRISTQLEVVKGRSGSTVRAVRGVG